VTPPCAPSAARRATNIAIAAGLAAPLLVSSLLSPEAVAGGPVLCWLRAVIGVPCPFCGMTRSFVAFAHGEIGEALRAHPAGPLLFVALVLGAALALRAAIAGAAALHTRPDVLRGAEAIAIACIAGGALGHVLEL
jgi:hypothetical protein